MYDELVKSIHCCFGFDSMQTDCENCMMKDKREEHNYVGCCDALGLAAADAIEELQKRVPKTPHGRLIDADALMTDIDHSIVFSGRGYNPAIVGASKVVERIEKAPTIIPAEEGE